MTKAETVASLAEAISEVEKATIPAIHQVIDSLKKNTDQMSASSKDLLGIADKNVDSITRAAARVASAGAQLLVAVLETTRKTPAQSRATSAGPKARARA